MTSRPSIYAAGESSVDSKGHRRSYITVSDISRIYYTVSDWNTAATVRDWLLTSWNYYIKKTSLQKVTRRRAVTADEEHWALVITLQSSLRKKRTVDRNGCTSLTACGFLCSWVSRWSLFTFVAVFRAHFSARVAESDGRKLLLMLRARSRPAKALRDAATAFLKGTGTKCWKKKKLTYHAS